MGQPYGSSRGEGARDQSRRDDPKSQVPHPVSCGKAREPGPRTSCASPYEVDLIVWAEFRRFLDAAAGSPGLGPKAAIHSNPPALPYPPIKAPPY